MKKNFTAKLKRFLGGENNYDSVGIRIGLAICAFVLFLWSLTLLYPFFWALINSFKTAPQYFADKMGFPPDGWHFENWVNAFTSLKVTLPNVQKVGFFTLIFNSLWYTFVGAFLTLAPSLMFSYVVAKYKFKFCKFLYAFSLVIMMIPIYGSMPANVKVFFSWGLADTPFYLIGGMGVIGGTTWLIFTSFMESLPWTYAEAVFIDGGGHWTVFLKVMLPMCMPIFLAMYVVECIAKWNDYLSPYIYLPSYPTLATGIYYLEADLKWNMPQYFATTLISIIPVLVIFVLCQEQIMNNVTIGGIKG
jgi:ABC-type glycerol-3-phosphate transport system permease component